jgi:hypothetical protein
MINNMKMYRFLILAFAVFFVASCAEDDFEGTTYPVTAYQGVDGALFTIDNVVNGFFDKVEPATSFVEFTITPSGGATPSSLDLQYTYNGKETITLQNVSSFPATINIPFPDILAGAGVDVTAVSVGDVVKFSLGNVSAGGGTYGSSRTINVPVSCASNLAGTYDYVSTQLTAGYGYDCPTGEVPGTVTFTDNGGGEYIISDLGFGQYESGCWNDGPATSGAATITDVCGKITSGGLDQYGLAYIWVITSVDGEKLSLSWSNNYADSGNTVITKPGGWPPLFTE